MSNTEVAGFMTFFLVILLALVLLVAVVRFADHIDNFDIRAYTQQQER